jgi:hypothetical protein
LHLDVQTKKRLEFANAMMPEILDSADKPFTVSFPSEIRLEEKGFDTCNYLL